MKSLAVGSCGFAAAKLRSRVLCGVKAALIKSVIPAYVGIMDPGFRRDDGFRGS